MHFIEALKRLSEDGGRIRGVDWADGCWLCFKHSSLVFCNNGISSMAEIHAEDFRYEWEWLPKERLTPEQKLEKIKQILNNE